MEKRFLCVLDECALSRNIGVVLKKKSLYPQIWNSILDRHHVWRSHDPNSVQTFDFCEKKGCHTPFFILHPDSSNFGSTQLNSAQLC